MKFNGAADESASRSIECNREEKRVNSARAHNRKDIEGEKLLY
jgi:hypothetical protein